MKKLNWKHILGALVLSIALTFVTVQAVRIIPRYFKAQNAKTDFGDFSGGSDYGGSWDSGSSWGGGSSWDSGGSYYDYDGYDDFGGIPGFYLFSFGFEIIWFIICIWFIIRIINRMQHNTVPVQPPQTGQSGSEVADAMADLKARDPGFSETRFLEDAANLYIRLQNAWTDRNLEPVRARLSEEQYAAAKRGVDQYLRAKQTNHVDRIAVLGTEIIGCFKDSRNDNIVVRMSTRITDYVTDDATGKVVRGDMNREKFMTYHWTMIRSLGKQTAVSGKISAKYCPHCGAPLDFNQSGECPFCRSIVTSDDHDWVLAKIEGISQRTV